MSARDALHALPCLGRLLAHGYDLMARFESLGASPFVNLARREVLETLNGELWDVGGVDQLVARFKDSVVVGDRILGRDAKFQLSLFVGRPEPAGARVALAVRLEQAPGLTGSEFTRMRDNIAASLRLALVDSPLGNLTATKSAVVSTRIPVDAADGDTAGAAEAALPRLREVLTSLRAVEPLLASWCDERLPRLIGRHGSGE